MRVFAGVQSLPDSKQVVWLLLTLGLAQACVPAPLTDDVEWNSPGPGNQSSDGGEAAGDAGRSEGADANPVPSADAGPPAPVDTGTVQTPEPEPPRPDHEDDAEILGIEVPETLECGQTAEFVVRVRNTGWASWTRANNYKLGAVGDDDPFLDRTRVWLGDADSVATGAEHRFRFEVQAPEEEGRYATNWQMVREGVHWFGESVARSIEVECEEVVEPQRPLPDMRHVVERVGRERPDLLRAACEGERAHWGFLDMLVDRLRTHDDRWGYNWKRGVIGDASRDCVAYFWGDGDREDSPDVYIIDVITGCRSDHPRAGWIDQTEATRRAGTIGRWTSRGRF